MKKHVFKVLTLFVLLSSIIQPAVSGAASSAIEIKENKPAIKMSVNGQAVKFTYGAPVVEGGTSLIPVRDLLVNLGISDDNEHIIWDVKTRTVTIIQGDTTISLAVDSKDIFKNGEVIKQLEIPAKIINDRVYLPARAVAETLGFIVTYDEKLHNIVITNEKPTDASAIEVKPENPAAIEVQPKSPIPVETLTHDANDKTSPTVVGVLSSTGYKVEVIFSEPVDKVTAENIANYVIKESYESLSSLSIVSAIQGTDRSKVILTTGPQTEATIYTLETSNVKDINENIIIPAPIKFLSSKGATAVTVIDQTEHVISLSKTTLEVGFGKKVTQSTAENVANYLIKETYGLRGELTITGAKLQADGITVILTTGDQSYSTLYSLSITNVTDSSQNAINSEKPLTFVGFSQQ